MSPQPSSSCRRAAAAAVLAVALWFSLNAGGGSFAQGSLVAPAAPDPASASADAIQVALTGNLPQRPWTNTATTATTTNETPSRVDLSLDPPPVRVARSSGAAGAAADAAALATATVPVDQTVIPLPPAAYTGITALASLGIVGSLSKALRRFIGQ